MLITDVRFIYSTSNRLKFYLQELDVEIGNNRINHKRALLKHDLVCLSMYISLTFISKYWLIKYVNHCALISLLSQFWIASMECISPPELRREEMENNLVQCYSLGRLNLVERDLNVLS